MGMFDDAMDALSYPQRKLKESVSGDEGEWFSPEGRNPHVYAAGNTALDLIADPLNLIPFGLLAKAAKLVPAAKLKGNFLSSAPNYIKNHYGLTDGPALPRGPERVIMAAMPNSMLDQEKLGLVRSITGKLEWGTEAAKNAAKAVLTPSGRATYADTGVNVGSQDTVARHLRSGQQPKASAQVNYNQHQNVQAGRTGATSAAMREVGENSNLVDYQPNGKGTVSQMLQEQTGEVVGTRKNAAAKTSPVNKKDADYIEDHMQTWGPRTDDVVMKRARSGHGGRHWQDWVKKSPMTSAVSAAFQTHAGVPTLKQLYETLKKIEKTQPAKKKNRFKIKNKSFEDVEKNGLWLHGSLPGSAITEGGVNWLSKIDVDGTMSGIISDKHDFLDKLSGKVAKAINKVPGVKVSPDITERSLLAVTPVMKTTVQAQRPKQFARLGKAGKPTKTYSGVPTPKQEGTQTAALERYRAAKASKATLRAERIRQAGALSVPAALVQDDRSSKNP